MPTGYTAGVVEGKVNDFEQFALQCARAFGALIEMRDSSWDAPIPEEFKPSTYNLERLEGAKKENLRLQSMTEEQVKEACETDYQEQLASRERAKSSEVLTNQRLEAMQGHVRNWHPPSANHVELKKFMLDQLEISKSDLSYYEKSPIKKHTPSEWLDVQLEKTQRDIGYHAAEHEKEIERVKGRNLWVKQLKDSLK